MKSLLFSALLALAAAPAALAQPQQGTSPTTAQAPPKTAAGTAAKPRPAPAEPLTDEQIDQRANALTANMQKNLGLVPQQVDKVRAINRRSVEGVETARARYYRSNPRKMRGIIDDISASRLAALKDVLNAAQFDKYQRKREEKMGLPNTQGVQGTAAPGLGGSE